MLGCYIWAVMSTSIYGTLVTANIGSSASHAYYVHSSKNCTTSPKIGNLQKKSKSDINNDDTQPPIVPAEEANYTDNIPISIENKSLKKTVFYIVCIAPLAIKVLYNYVSSR